MDIHNINTFLIDGDGVLWYGQKPAEGLVRFFEVLKDRGINWALLTNNSTGMVGMYLDKLIGFGIEATADQVYTGASATAAYLAERYPAGSAIYVVGEDGLLQTLREAGFDVHDGPQMPEVPVVAVIGSMDRGLTYDKLDIANRLIRGGAPYIGTNPDRTYPTAHGLAPGAGTVVEAIAIASETEPIIIGKPKTAIFEEAIKGLGADPAHTAMIGDRLETDIAGGIAAGIGTILLLSGVTSPEHLVESDIKPDCTYEDLAALTEAILSD